MRTKITFDGETKFELIASDLQLIADALIVISPDSDEAWSRARNLAVIFESLAQVLETPQEGHTRRWKATKKEGI